MNVLALFVLLVAGAVAGYLLRGRDKAIAFNRAATRIALASLLVVMGTRLGQGRALFARDLGLLTAAAGSSLLLVAVFFLAFLGLRPFLHLGKAEGGDGGVPTHWSHELLTVGLNVAWIALGFALFLALPAGLAARLPLDRLADWVLRILLAVVGFDLGAEFHRLRLRDLPLPLLLLPLADILLSLACGAGFALLKGVPPRQGMLLTAGMGWYSLSSVLIAQKGLAVLSIVAFIHNVARELLAILTAPLAARVSPYLPIYLGGATSMDVMLPFVQRYAGRRYTLVSFYSGVVCSLAVIPLVRILLGA
jgi:uncharacterized membrane protein YbjE (DUF340 family)